MLDSLEQSDHNLLSLTIDEKVEVLEEQNNFDGFDLIVDIGRNKVHLVIQIKQWGNWN